MPSSVNGLMDPSPPVDAVVVEVRDDDFACLILAGQRSSTEFGEVGSSRAIAVRPASPHAEDRPTEACWCVVRTHEKKLCSVLA